MPPGSIDARVCVSGKDPLAQPVGGIGPKARTGPEAYPGLKHTLRPLVHRLCFTPGCYPCLKHTFKCSMRIVCFRRHFKTDSKASSYMNMALLVYGTPKGGHPEGTGLGLR